MRKCCFLALCACLFYETGSQIEQPDLNFFVAKDGFELLIFLFLFSLPPNAGIWQAPLCLF